MLCDYPERWDREGGARQVQEGGHVNLWPIHVDVWQKPL